MTRFALKGMLGRKLRTVLTALAIVLGVAMVSGTYVLTDTIDKAFSNLISETYAETDARVTGKAVDISSQGESAQKPSVPEEMLEDVRALPSVAVAGGSIVDEETILLGKEGKAISGDATFALGLDTSSELDRFNPTNLVAGRWPSGPSDTVIDAGTADREDYRVGDTIGVSAVGPVRDFEIVGIAQYGGVDSIGSATFAVFDVPTAQALVGKVGKLDEIFVAAKEGVSPDLMAIAKGLDLLLDCETS